MPDDPDSGAQDLLARLNALRPSTISLSQSTPVVSNKTSNQDTASSDLAARFASLSGAGRSIAANRNLDTTETPDASIEPEQETNTATEHNDEDDRTLDELLADLGPDEAWDLEPNDEAQANDLLRQAQNALKLSREEEKPATEAGRTGDAAQDNSDKQDGDAKDSIRENDAEDQPSLTEDQEADEIVRLMLAEVSLDERDSENARLDDPEASKDKEEHEDDDNEPKDNESDGGDDLVQLPTAPSDLPSVAHSSDERLLPAAPSTVPAGRPPADGARSSPVLQKFTDEEIDTWCIICNDDATMRCLGCDGDLYCGNCWFEGHKSPEAGYEERTHKAVAFVKPGKGTKKQTKTRARVAAS